MINDDYITAEERYSRSLTWIKVKKFFYKNFMKIEVFIWATIAFLSLFSAYILCFNI